MFKKILILGLLLISTQMMAQTGILRGKITEATTGEGAIGATVTLAGTTNAAFTDIDGEFTLTVPYGKHNLIISYVGFQKKTIADIIINEKKGEVYLENIVLDTDTQTLQEVVVRAELLRTSEAAITMIKHNSSVILDGISSAKMKITGDATAVEAAKRITGVSIEGGKYVYVRGLGDRYTKTTLNGMDIPGLDPDRNSLQMDIFPTSLIDNIMVSKNFSAEMPADFTGGLMNVETKAFPEHKVFNVSFGVGYNPQANLKSDFLTYDGGKYDFLGFDDGSRELPGLAAGVNVPTPISGHSKEEVTSFVKSFNPELATKTKTSPLNYSGGITFGDQRLLGQSSNKLGYILSLNYKLDYQFYDDVNYGEYQRYNDASLTEMRYATVQNGQYTDESVLLGGLAGLAFKGKSTKIRLTAMRLQNGEKRAGIFDIDNDGAAVGQSGYIAKSNNLEYNQRSLNNFLLAGTHLLSNDKLEIDWKLSTTYSISEDPDIRKSAFTYTSNNDIVFSAGAGGLPSRIWRDLDEVGQNGRVDLSYGYAFKGNSAKVRIGANVLRKERNFEIKQFQMAFFGGAAGGTWATDDFSTILNEGNIYPNKQPNNIYYQSGNNDPNPNEYNSRSLNQGYYVSNEMSFGDRTKVIAGLRLEEFKQYHTGRDQSYASGDIVNGRNLDDEVVLSSVNLFPSLNVIYKLGELANARFAYAKTIARPSFKELSFAQIIDPLTNRIFNGSLFTYSDWDGELLETKIDNFDLRLEKYGERGELISLSGFYKKFRNPIELIRIPEQQTSTEYQPRNVGDGMVLGVELELIRNLSFVSQAMQDWQLSLNFSAVKSQIDMSASEYNSRLEYVRDGETIEAVRKMAGQAPYILNGGISYNSFEKGLDMGLFYNVKGSTLNIVGIGLFPDVYTEAFHSLNFGLNKKLGKSEKLSLDVKASNILDDTVDVVYKSYKAENQMFSSHNPGRSFSVGLNFKL
ncbi:TonB-dependent receptor [Arcticibacterium luteifluviistationis]|nr:TonB-dependent receptor [Arcticibacterium luteifluviistationis]